MTLKGSSPPLPPLLLLLSSSSSGGVRGRTETHLLVQLAQPEVKLYVIIMLFRFPEARSVFMSYIFHQLLKFSFSETKKIVENEM